MQSLGFSINKIALLAQRSRGHVVTWCSSDSLHNRLPFAAAFFLFSFLGPEKQGICALAGAWIDAKTRLSRYLSLGGHQFSSRWNLSARKYLEPVWPSGKALGW